MGVISQKDDYFFGKAVTFTLFQYGAAGTDSFKVDQSADDGQTIGGTLHRAMVYHMEGGTAPDAVISTSNADFTKTVTIGGVTAGTFGKIMIITVHGGSFGSTKP